LVMEERILEKCCYMGRITGCVFGWNGINRIKKEREAFRSGDRYIK